LGSDNPSKAKQIMAKIEMGFICAVLIRKIPQFNRRELQCLYIFHDGIVNR